MKSTFAKGVGILAMANNSIGVRAPTRAEAFDVKSGCPELCEHPDGLFNI
jgi:hypothetical protein